MNPREVRFPSFLDHLSCSNPSGRRFGVVNRSLARNCWALGWNYVPLVTAIASPDLITGYDLISPEGSLYWLEAWDIVESFRNRVLSPLLRSSFTEDELLAIRVHDEAVDDECILFPAGTAYSLFPREVVDVGVNPHWDSFHLANPSRVAPIDPNFSEGQLQQLRNRRSMYIPCTVPEPGRVCVSPASDSTPVISSPLNRPPRVRRPRGVTFSFADLSIETSGDGVAEQNVINLARSASTNTVDTVNPREYYGPRSSSATSAVISGSSEAESALDLSAIIPSSSPALSTRDSIGSDIDDEDASVSGASVCRVGHNDDLAERLSDVYSVNPFIVSVADGDANDVNLSPIIEGDEPVATPPNVSSGRSCVPSGEIEDWDDCVLYDSSGVATPVSDVLRESSRMMVDRALAVVNERERWSGVIDHSVAGYYGRGACVEREINLRKREREDDGDVSVPPVESIIDFSAARVVTLERRSDVIPYNIADFRGEPVDVVVESDSPEISASNSRLLQCTGRLQSPPPPYPLSSGRNDDIPSPPPPYFDSNGMHRMLDGRLVTRSLPEDVGVIVDDTNEVIAVPSNADGTGTHVVSTGTEFGLPLGCGANGDVARFVSGSVPIPFRFSSNGHFSGGNSGFSRVDLAVESDSSDDDLPSAACAGYDYERHSPFSSGQASWEERGNVMPLYRASTPPPGEDGCYAEVPVDHSVLSTPRLIHSTPFRPNAFSRSSTPVGVGNTLGSVEVTPDDVIPMDTEVIMSSSVSGSAVRVAVQELSNLLDGNLWSEVADSINPRIVPSGGVMDWDHVAFIDDMADLVRNRPLSRSEHYLACRFQGIYEYPSMGELNVHSLDCLNFRRQVVQPLTRCFSLPDNVNRIPLVGYLGYGDYTWRDQVTRVVSRRGEITEFLRVRVPTPSDLSVASTDPLGLEAVSAASEEEEEEEVVSVSPGSSSMTVDLSSSLPCPFI
jgi:hypothetical protein